MKTEELKSNIHALIDKTNDAKKLEYVANILNHKIEIEETDWYDELTDEQKKDLDEAELEIENEENLVDHEDVKLIIKEWQEKYVGTKERLRASLK